jgi:type IV secretion system protein VirB8
MDESNVPSRADYYTEGGSWARDQERARARSSRLAWALAAAAVFVAVCEAIALVAITPLKTVVPYTLLVDRQTGHVEALDPLKASTIAPDAALTRSFLAQYVIARESFAIDTLQGDYRKVALWSAGDARTAYVSGMQASNPESPLNLLPRRAVLQTRIKSVSSLNRNSSLVRFETYRADASDAAPSHWVAIVTYRYSDAPLDMESRLLNPLGFQVTRYRRNAEAPPLPVIPAANPVPAPAPDVAAPAQPAP